MMFSCAREVTEDPNDPGMANLVVPHIACEASVHMLLCPGGSDSMHRSQGSCAAQDTAGLRCGRA